MFRYTRTFPRAHRGFTRITTLCLLASLCFAFARPYSAAHAQATSTQAKLPTNLSSTLVHPGSALVAFRTPLLAVGAHVEADSSGLSTASALDVGQINAILDSLHASEVRHLFTNIPADKLNAARAKAMAATGSYVTDFTQVYQVSFDPAINDGAAVNELATAAIVSSAMPDWIYALPKHEKAPQLAQTVQLAAANAQLASALKLPPNYSYITDGQSYHDAAANNVTGAFKMLYDKFGKTPGEGEVITNISLGLVNDKSTVLEKGQRYLEQRGYPKIPVWLSSQQCTPASGTSSSCSVILDPTATNEKDPNQQYDLGEVMLDFSVMAPPPRGDKRVPNPQQPGQLGEILGAAYGADFRLINPLNNNTADFFAAWLGGGLLQSPAPTVMTASIGDGALPGFSGNYFFEEEAMIHDIVSLLVNGEDIFVTISAGDGQTDTGAAMNPNGIIGSTEVTTDPSKVVDINENGSYGWNDPRFSYSLTFEPQYLIDSGANSSGGTALNDVFNNAPWNSSISTKLRHNQTTTETRWTGQQNFNSGYGSRTNLAAPADDILYLEQVDDGPDGLPTDPTASEPGLIGGTSASCPEIAAAAAVLRQASKLLGMPLSARDTRALLVESGRDNTTPIFDLDHAYVGKVLDLTRAMEMLYAKAGVKGSTAFVRMTVAQRKAVPYSNGYARGFYSDTPQDPSTNTATINLAQGLVDPSTFNNETIGDSGDNLNAPITFGVDAAYLPLDATFSWKLSYSSNSVWVSHSSYNDHVPYLRLLPSEIFGLLGLPTTSTRDRFVYVTAKSNGQYISTKVTFKGQSSATYTHAVPPSFNPYFQPASTGAGVTFSYDLRGLRGANGGVLIISDIDRVLPRAFSDRDPDAHGFKTVLSGLTGKVTIPAAAFPHGVGAYGVALRGTAAGKEIAGSTSAWLPLRYAPQLEAVPPTPKVLAVASAQGATAPVFYDIADYEKGGSSRFSVFYNVASIPGAKGALIELSAPTANFFKGLFVTGDVPLVNNFTNPYGDRLDTGNNLGQPGSVYHKAVASTSGSLALDGKNISGLTVPAASCDLSVQVRVFATDASGKIIGVASNPSVLSYGNLSAAACK